MGRRQVSREDTLRLRESNVCWPQAQSSFQGGAEPQPPPPSLSKHHLGRDKGHRSDGNFRGQAESLVEGGSHGDTAPRDGGTIYARVGERNRPIYLKRGLAPAGKCTAGDCGDADLQRRGPTPAVEFA